MKRALATASLVLLSTLAIGCKEKRTVVVLVADTDLRAGREVDGIEFEVTGPSDERQSARTVVAEGELPATLGLLHEKGQYGPFEVVVRAVLRRSMIVERRATFSFIRQRTVMLRLDLLRACADVGCGPEMTCAAGRCRAIEIDSDEFEGWDGEPERVDGSVPPVDDGCVPTTEICNEADDDCDDRLDEGFDLGSVEHCGECTRTCQIENAIEACVEFECTIASCEPGWDDCDENATNGCEVDLNTLANCGGCGNDCDLPNAESSCMDRVCEIQRCMDGWGDCDGVVENGCEQSLTTLGHCGECNRACNLPHADEVCVDGVCEVDSCESGWSNCNDVEADGCEAWLSSPATCRRCTRMCDAGEVCAGESPTVRTCPNSCTMPYQSCGRSCVLTSSEPQHCGGCGEACPTVPHALSTCEDSECGFECDQEFADCDDNSANGCEAHLGDPDHCGSCETQCSNPTPLCISNGVGGFRCAAS